MKCEPRISSLLDSILVDLVHNLSRPENKIYQKMSSSLGENTMPAAAILSLKGAAAASSELQQQQQARQVLGNVGNSGVNLAALINQKKEQFVNQVSWG